jgi:hypothetical protein
MPVTIPTPITATAIAIAKIGIMLIGDVRDDELEEDGPDPVVIVVVFVVVFADGSE